MRGGGGRSADGPRAVGAIVARLIDESGLRVQAERSGVLERWPSLVGPSMAKVTRASGVSGATLFVEVSSSPWLMELSGMRREMLALVNRAVPEHPFDRIVLRLGAWDEPPSRPPRPQTRTAAPRRRHDR